MWIAAGPSCSGGAPRHAAPSSPPYVALFAPAHVWTLRTVSDAVTCRIADTARLGDASVAHVTCDKPHDDLGIIGWWVATPAGLYHPYTQPQTPDEIAALGEDDLLLNARPTERHHSISVGPTQETIDVVPLGGAWCATSATQYASERREWTLCVGDAGITGIADVVSGPHSDASSVRAGALPPIEEGSGS